MTEAFHFPCSFPLKVMGRNVEADKLFAVVASILEKHLSLSDEVTYHTRTSSKGNYVSVTATFVAESREQLDTIYRELPDHELVLMTL